VNTSIIATGGDVRIAESGSEGTLFELDFPEVSR